MTDPRMAVGCWMMVLTLGGLLAGESGPLDAAEVQWKRTELDPRFRSEGVAVGDFNHDGKQDIATGDLWYAAPDWTPHEFRPVGDYEPLKGYSNCFASWAYDINQDGWDDLIVVGFPGDPFHWYENPQGKSVHWPQHVIWHSICNESPQFQDVTGDGKPDLLFGSQPEQQMGFIEIPPPDKCTQPWQFHAISKPGDPMRNGTFKYYHGLGVGDINGDGRSDVIIPDGWWEAPADRTAGLWDFHPNPLTKPGQSEPLRGSDIQVMDLDQDGDADIVMSSAHDFGVWWFENPGKDSKEPFKYHLIDETFSQTHALWLGNLYGGSQPYLVTGKRYAAHGKNDPGALDPVVMVSFRIEMEPGKPPRFVREDLTSGLGTGVGTQFTVQDLNGDGHLDIILSNKSGVNILVQSAK
jgi:hypothetical protein